ncbi:MAG TPA: histidine phosphatase family protein [Solirubrobacterales bacterium]|nr:histidine phosphatase family protein [Solirubrobacterales bacterium]
MIYLLRHGVAERTNGEDAKRRLTGEGRRQSAAAGRALAALGAPIEACLTSPKLRAAETAELACQALGIPAETADSLAGGPFDALELAAGRGEAMLVGHEPDLSNEIARLTGAKAKLHKGGLAIVDGNTLLALLGPQELAAIAAGGNQARA